MVGKTKGGASGGTIYRLFFMRYDVWMIVFSVMEMFKRLEREDAELRKRHNEDPYFLITPPVTQINQLFIKILYFHGV